MNLNFYQRNCALNWDAYLNGCVLKWDITIYATRKIKNSQLWLSTYLFDKFMSFHQHWRKRCVDNVKKWNVIQCSFHSRNHIFIYHIWYMLWDTWGGVMDVFNATWMLGGLVAVVGVFAKTWSGVDDFLIFFLLFNYNILNTIHFINGFKLFFLIA